jgi:hypothetical protein
MMRLVLTIIVLSLFSVGSAQQLLPIQHDTNTYNQEFILTGLADFGATSIENALSSKFLFGGNITNEIKDNSLEKHKGINRLGLDITSELEYRNMKVNLFGKENLGFTVKGGYYSYMSSLYSKDLFGLAFYGNESFLGENADFSGSRFSAMTFQKIGFGVIDKKKKSNVSLNLYAISNYSEGNVRDGKLFQSDSGDSVSLTFDGEFQYASTNTFLKGYGVGVDLDFRIPVVLKEGKTAYIQFLAKNLGFAHVNSTVTQYSADTVLNFDGFTFNQLIGDANIFNANSSILDTLGIDSTSITKIRFLPGFIQIGKIVDVMNTSKLQSFFGVRMYPSVSYVPMIYAGVQYKTARWLDLGANVSYGGFTTLRFGLYSQIKLNKFALGISSENLVGIFSSEGKGQSVILRLRLQL